MGLISRVSSRTYRARNRVKTQKNPLKMVKIPPVLARALPLAQKHAKKHLKFISVEMAPPLNPATWFQAAGEFAGMFTQKRFMNLTFGQAALNSLVFMEICCWFAVGELIGKHWAHKSIPMPFTGGLPVVGDVYGGIIGNWGTWCGYNVTKKIDGKVVWPNEEGKYVV